MRTLAALVVLLTLPGAVDAGMTADSKQVARVETIYADCVDAYTTLEAIDSGLFKSYRGKNRAAWNQVYGAKRKALQEQLSKLPAAGLSQDDAKAVAAMRTRLESLPETVSALFNPQAKCQDAQRDTLDYDALRAALVACFVELGNNLAFENGTINRVAALNLLHVTDEPERRKAVFMAFVPLWQALNGNDEPGSPYRRMIAMAGAEGAAHGSEIDAVARSAGIETSAVERWLEQILDAWRQASPDQPVEPWDFRYRGSEANRLLASAIPREALLPITLRFFKELGADLEQLGTVFDLEPRPGKAALAYTDWIVAGRVVRGKWQPTIPRVSAPYSSGGLFVLNELVHEDGHVVNFAAMRNRPAFMDWAGGFFGEAFADVPAWSTYEPAWQRRYLGRESPEQASLRSLYTVVVLDAAWSLFELRMLREPKTDPNALWTEITSRYLHVVPHPELSWWAQRVQLVDAPGYMANYGLGAVLTADLRQHIREALGPFDAGDARWYSWLSERLLRYGSERDGATLVKEFLGRPVSPEALLAQFQRMVAPSVPSSALGPLVVDGQELHASLVTRELEDAARLRLAPVLRGNPYLSTDAEFVNAIAQVASQGRLGGEGIRAALYALYLGESELGLYGLEAASPADADRLEGPLRGIWAYNESLGRARVHREGKVLVVVWSNGVSPSCWEAVNAGVVERLTARRPSGA